MDVLLSEEEASWREAAAGFAERALAREDLRARDRDGVFDREAWRACAEFGVLGMTVPERFGGLGLPAAHLVAALEGLGRACPDRGLLFSLNAHLWTCVLPILEHGSEAQRDHWLPRLCDGRAIGANAATEPDAGSDVFALRTRARRDGADFVLEGTKIFVTNAPVCDLLVVYATVDPDLGAMGVTAFLVERERPGVSVGPPIEKMGLRTSPMAEVVLDGCRVPAESVLGRVGRGARVFDGSMEWERGCILASCVGAMERVLGACVRHARTRRQFGRAIGGFQAVANRLVDMKVRIETCRPLVYAVARRKDRGEPAGIESALAKLHVSESYVATCRDALQVFGGYGYTCEQEVERELRDALGSTLYSGTSEIQRNLIARGLGL